MIKKLFLVTLVSILFIPGLPATQGVEFEPFVGDSTFLGIVGLLPEGDVHCIGGEPTGGWPVCSPETIRSVIRGVLLEHYQTSVDSPFTGIRVSVLNANLDRENRGPMWGTWRLELDEGGGVSEGTYTGTMDPVSIQWHAVGNGTEGTVEGVQSRLSGTADSSLNEVFTGYYFLPPGKR